MTRRLPTILAAFVLTATACAADNESSSPEDPFATAATGLCDAAGRADNPEEARRVFFDTVHQPLHELADDTATRDRTIAADLLQAKQAVEVALEDTASALPEILDRLVAATDEALDVLDRPGLDCGGER